MVVMTYNHPPLSSGSLVRKEEVMLCYDSQHPGRWTPITLWWKKGKDNPGGL